MNTFELTLVDALRAEAEEIAMTVNTQRAAEELESRLDDADRSRHRTYWVAAAVVVLLISGVAALTGSWPREQSSAPPAAPPAATHVQYTSAIFVVPFSVSMPPWLSEHLVYGQGRNGGQGPASPHEMSWEAVCDTDVCADGSDLALRFVSPSGIYRPGDKQQRAVPDYADYLAFLQDMESTYGLTISDESAVSVSGLPATVMTITPTQVTEGASFACPNPGMVVDDCWWPSVGASLRLAVIDHGDTPLLIWTKANAANPAWPEIEHDFDAMLETVRLDPAPSPTGH